MMVEQGQNLQALALRPTRRDLRKDDSLSRQGAARLAQRLQDYWHSNGYLAARFWTEPITERFDKLGTHEIYRVKCNLVDGRPPRYRDDR